MRTRVLLAVLLAVAGCAAPTATPTSQSPTDQRPTTTTDTGIVATDASFPYNASRVLQRVERLHGRNATGPIRVTEFESTARSPRDLTDRLFGIRPAGALALGLYTNATVRTGAALGVTYSDAVVRLAATPRTYPQELVLAHELTHVLQYQHDFAAIRQLTSGLLSTDRTLAVRAVLEGDAQRTAVAYRNRYLPNAPRPLVPFGNVTRERWQAAFTAAYYHYGYQYVRGAAADGRSRAAVLDDPPRSTRALLHPGVNATKPALADPPRNATLQPDRYDTVGELGLRLALRANGVPAERAAAAAFGWRNGRMTYYGTGPSGSVHWRTTWQNSTDARAFADAWRGLLDARNATRERGLLVVPATDTTPRFYANVTVTGDSVTVVAGGNETRVRRLAQLSSSRSDSSSASTVSSSTDASTSASVSFTDRSPVTSSRSVSSSASTSSSARS